MEATITLWLSEAQQANYPHQTTQMSFTVPCPDGAWLQFTFEELRDQEGNFLGLQFDNGLWHYDNKAWSDLTIQFTSVD